MHRRPYRRNYAATGAVDPDAIYPHAWWVPWLSGAIGATIAVALGRSGTKTRIANAVIGGSFAGSAAYIDYQSTVTKTLLVAAVEGAIWGITDRSTPMIKEALLGPHAPATATATA